MGKLTLILGGARSGKSSLAQRLAETQNQPVLYIATAQGLDQEMIERIQRHKQERPMHWQTLEIPSHVRKNLTSNWTEAGFVLLDCSTLLIANLLLETSIDPDLLNENQAQRAVQQEFEELVDLIRSGKPDWVIVSNEVGMGLVPPYPLGRVYRDLLGWFNQRLAAVADEVIWMVAGIPIPISQYRNQGLEP